MPQLPTRAERPTVRSHTQGRLLIRCHDEARMFVPDPLLGWSTLIQGNLDIVDVPGSHTTAMSPGHGKAVAEVVELRLSER